ncbi:class I SAM-dependent methyltransferase [Brevibacillus gelatini]|uniref:class I SAM-dependent methyltransferase n=1 Tax=Brevibacillus gelatini TaxID=1655277 RepID=UPI003D81C2C2
MSNRLIEWNQSYINRDNFVFHPHEEVIRFVSKYITKRIGLNSFTPVHGHSTKPKILDVGCGIGRHIFFCHQMELDAYGIDLSTVAISTAHEWAANLDFPNADQRIIQGDIRALPWDTENFHYAISHGVFDSMHFEIAKTAIAETARVLQKGALFYCDLISGDDSKHSREYASEEIVQTQHEKGTVQSYFNYKKILELIGDHFEIVEANLIRKENILSGDFFSRYHLVLKKI